jgi:hypothetical protein
MSALLPGRRGAVMRHAYPALEPPLIGEFPKDLPPCPLRIILQLDQLHVCVVTIFTSLFIFANTALSDDGSCIHCGMMKAKFGHSWAIIEHDDGTIEGVCSVHCAAVDMALHTDKPVKKITVGDYNTKNQIDADTAYWVKDLLQAYSFPKNGT